MDGVWTEDTFALYSCPTANQSAKLMYYHPHPAFRHGVDYLITCLQVLTNLVLHETNHMGKIYHSLEKEKCREKKMNL
jgi:hypothetical protein